MNAGAQDPTPWDGSCPCLVASSLLGYTSLESPSQTRLKACLLGDSRPHQVDSIKYHTL